MTNTHETAITDVPESSDPSPKISRTKPKLAGLRTLAATVLVIVGTALLTPAITAYWFNTEILDTGAYVENVTPTLSDPAVKKFVATRATDYLVEQVNARTNVPGVLSATLGSTLEPQVEELLTLPVVQDQWVAANRLTHETLINALQSDNSNVDIDLTSILITLQEQLVAKDIPVISSTLSQIVIPPDQLNLQIIEGDSANTARTAYDVADTSQWALPLGVIVLFALALIVAWRRRGTLLAIGLAMFLTGVFFVAALATGSEVLRATGRSKLQADAAYAIATSITDSLRSDALIILISGAVLAVVAVVLFVLPKMGPTKNSSE